MRKTLLPAAMGLVLQIACAPDIGAPFPASFEMAGTDQFKLLVTGNNRYPANTQSGEEQRLRWLGEYLTRNRLCPLGYDIIERKLEHVSMSAKRGAEEQKYRSITYIGRCKTENGGFGPNLRFRANGREGLESALAFRSPFERLSSDRANSLAKSRLADEGQTEPI